MMTLTIVRERPRVEHAPPPQRHEPAAAQRRLRHWFWLAAAFPLAFAFPFLLADTLALNRDLFYGLYALAVAGFVAGWARHTGLTSRDLTRNWRWGLVLGAVGAGATSMIVLRTEDATVRPGGIEFIGALLWRGVVYGATDGVLLSVFPILAVFGGFAGTRLRTRRSGTAAVGFLALIASLGVTAVYHLGYSDFRSEKVRKPLIGDMIWSAPTLLTLSPFGAPIAHIGLHVSAVVHSYDTNTFLPPHDAAGANVATAALAPQRHDVVVYLLRGVQLAPAARVVTGSRVAAAAVRAVLRGPTAHERDTGFTSAAPAMTRLRSLGIANGSAVVDLSAAYASGGGSLSMAARLAQVTYTLTQFPTVKRVVYLLEGHRLETLGGEGLIVDKPQTRALYEQARSDSLEAGLLGKVFVDRPAQGAAFTNPLAISGSASRTFTLTIANWDGRILAERTIRNATGTRRPFSVSVPANPGLYPRGTLVVRAGGAVTEIALGTAQ